MQGCITF